MLRLQLQYSITEVQIQQFDCSLLYPITELRLQKEAQF
jgi:hypothetical protein